MLKNYDKLPSSIDEQLNILRRRGMVIDNESMAREFLSEHYFYRFLNYSVPFFATKSANNDKRYVERTKFSDVLRVYNFDSKLRLLILEYIEQIEISVKTQFIHLSWKYGPHFYLNRKLFKDRKIYNDSLERIEYQTRVSSDLLINEYLVRYDSPDIPPIWSAVEMMSIGQFAKWYTNLKSEDDKEEIAKHYKLHHTVLQAILENFTLIRNYSAHYARIWNRHYDFSFCIRDEKYKLIHDLLCEDGDSIYIILLLMTYMLNELEVSDRFVQDLTNMINKYQINVSSMGFASNWQDVFKEVQRA